MGLKETKEKNETTVREQKRKRKKTGKDNRRREMALETDKVFSSLKEIEASNLDIYH